MTQILRDTSRKNGPLYPLGCTMPAVPSNSLLTERDYRSRGIFIGNGLLIVYDDRVIRIELSFETSYRLKQLAGWVLTQF